MHVYTVHEITGGGYESELAGIYEHYFDAVDAIWEFAERSGFKVGWSGPCTDGARKDGVLFTISSPYYLSFVIGRREINEVIE